MDSVAKNKVNKRKIEDGHSETEDTETAEEERSSNVEQVGGSMPSMGLDIRKLGLRYRDNLPLTLRNLTFKLNPKERCAVVGRTGAGKSSLAVALFRLGKEHLGSVRLNGVDLSLLPVDE